MRAVGGQRLGAGPGPGKCGISGLSTASDRAYAGNVGILGKSRGAADARGPDGPLAAVGSAEQYRLLAENASDIVLAFVGDELVWASPSVQRLLGYTPADLMGPVRVELLHPDDVSTVSAAMAQLRCGAAVSLTQEVRLAHRDGTYTWWQATGRVIAGSPGADVVLALRDIDAEVNSRDRAEIERDLRTAAVWSMLDPHLLLQAVWGEDGQLADLAILAANPAACTAMGQERDRLVGARLGELEGTVGSRDLFDGCMETMRSGRPVVLDDEPYWPEGSAGELRFDVRMVRFGADRMSVTWRDVTDRHQKAAALAAAEARFRTAMDSAAIGMCLVAPDGTFLQVNRPICGLLGRDASALRATTWQQVTHPADLAADLSLAEQVLAGSLDSYQLRKRFLRPDGTVVHGDLSVGCVRSETGEVRYFVSQVVDVSEQVLAQEALAASRDQYRLLAEYAMDVVFRGNNDGITQWVSESVSRLLGRSPAELVGQRFTDLVHPSDLARARAVQEQLLTGVGATYEARMATADGAWRWLEITAHPVRDDAGVVIGHAGGWRDVHARVLATRALADAEARYRSLAQSAAVGLVVIGPNGRLLEVNDAACELLGRGRGALVASAWADLSHPDERVADRDLLHQVQTGQLDRARRATRFVRPDGEVVWADLAVAAVRNPGGDVDYLIAQTVDITAAVAAEARLADSEQQYRMLAENSADVILQVGLDLIIWWASPSAAESLGRAPSELVGRSLADLVSPDQAADLRSWADRPAGSSVAEDFTVLTLQGDGSHRWMQLRATQVPALANRPAFHVVRARDAHAEVLANSALSAERALLSATLEAMIDPHMILQPVRVHSGGTDMVCLQANPAAAAFLGASRQDLIGRDLLAALGQPAQQLVQWCAQVADTGVPLVIEAQPFTARDCGAECYVSARITRVGDAVAANWTDVTERVTTARELAQSRQQYRLLAENATDAVFSASAEGVLTFVSEGVTRILGVAPATLVGRQLADLVHPEDRDRVPVHLFQEDSTRPLRLRMRQASGSYIWVDVNATAVRDAQGNPAGLVGGWHDVHVEVAAQDELLKLARTDSLTGLQNRGEIISGLAAILAHPPRAGQQVAVIFADLDGLKKANDTQGHAAGNTLITTTAQRIRATVRSSDLVGRLGGDEFLIILTDVRGPSDAAAVAESIRIAMTSPIASDPDGQPLVITISIGVAMAVPGDDVDTLIARADLAMYSAKHAGGNAVAGC